MNITDLDERILNMLAMIFGIITILAIFLVVVHYNFNIYANTEHVQEIYFAKLLSSASCLTEKIGVFSEEKLDSVVSSQSVSCLKSQNIVFSVTGKTKTWQLGNPYGFELPVAVKTREGRVYPAVLKVGL
ncbi:MAG: hypothetical protein HY362_03710 [Candidatus Aenigmarchaeota archaeon]|nr:hypothetical protein [Candidatus Aenigmarchaeota archaeon]